MKLSSFILIDEKKGLFRFLKYQKQKFIYLQKQTMLLVWRTDDLRTERSKGMREEDGYSGMRESKNISLSISLNNFQGLKIFWPEDEMVIDSEPAVILCAVATSLVLP